MYFVVVYDIKLRQPVRLVGPWPGKQMALNWITRNEANFSRWEQAQVFAITPPEYAFVFNKPERGDKLTEKEP